eukprot:g4684.t1
MFAGRHYLLRRSVPTSRRNLQTGFVGLPNVGKSTLFNALVKGSTAEAANFPFCTIEPNTGIVAISDRRLERLGELSESETITRATLTFVDIAGLVEGASEGAGLGNKFLSDIRQCDAIVHVIRCFDREKSDIVHVLDGDIDPVRDAAVINNELILSDMAQIERRLARVGKKAGHGDEIRALESLRDELENGVSIRKQLSPRHKGSGRDDDDDKEIGADAARIAIVRELGLLTAKPMIYAANIDESDVGAKRGDESNEVRALRDFAAEEGDSIVVAVSAQLESELMELDDEDRDDYLTTLGISEADTAMYVLTQAASDLLNLMVFYTSGPSESRAWQCRRGIKAPEAAGIIHTDFQKKFIRAECVGYENLIASGNTTAAKDAGLLRAEGKDYVVQDGDVLLFRHGA